DRRWSFWWMDCTVPLTRWGASHPYGCVGSRQFTVVLRRRDARDARHLRARPTLHGSGRAFPPTMDFERAQMETTSASSHCLSLDGRRRRRSVGVRLARPVAGGENSPHAPFAPRTREAVAPN